MYSSSRTCLNEKRQQCIYYCLKNWSTFLVKTRKTLFQCQTGSISSRQKSLAENDCCLRATCIRIDASFSYIQDKCIATLSRYFVPCLLEANLIFPTKILIQTERADFEEKACRVNELITLYPLFLVIFDPSPLVLKIAQSLELINFIRILSPFHSIFTEQW